MQTGIFKQDFRDKQGRLHLRGHRGTVDVSPEQAASLLNQEEQIAVNPEKKEKIEEAIGEAISAPPLKDKQETTAKRRGRKKKAVKG